MPLDTMQDDKDEDENGGVDDYSGNSETKRFLFFLVFSFSRLDFFS